MSQPSANQDLLQRSLQAVWHPCTQMKWHEQLPLLPIQSAQGIWLYDMDGKRYLDAISSWWVNLFGHQEPRIKQAIIQQLNQVEHVMLAGFTHQSVVQLSEALAKHTGLGHCFYASDGASATEIALKMSFHYWRQSGQPHKQQFISLQQSYHGETLGALSVTDVPIFKDTYAPLLRHAHTLPSPDWRLAEAGESAQDYARRCAQQVEDYLAQHHQQIAAMIIEPLVQCAGGMAMYDPIYLQLIRDSCQRYQVHLIADEIAVGFGRTGTMFACQQAAIKPDLLCLSKGISGGFLPLSVTLCSEQIYQAFYHDEMGKGFLHSHSYTGNPLACAAALASLAIFEQDDVLHHNATMQQWINQQLQSWQDIPIQHQRNCGMIWAFDVRTEHADFARRCYQAAQQHGLLLRPIGNTVYWMPPYCIDQQQAEYLIQHTQQVILQCA
jgi:adenosylmethionine-8-amino-7-oxononanoate aminotransferase